MFTINIKFLLMTMKKCLKNEFITTTSMLKPFEKSSITLFLLKNKLNQTTMP